MSDDTGRCCTNCGKSVEDESYLYWAFKTCRHCAYEADGRFRDCGSARKWRYFPRWHFTQHPELPQHKRERLATDGGRVEDSVEHSLIDEGELCDLCQYFEAKVTEEVECAETGERRFADLCIECRDKGLAHRRGEDVDFSPEIRLNERKVRTEPDHDV